MVTSSVTIKTPHLANSTMSTASGAAICLNAGPNWCAQLHSSDREGNKSTEIKYDSHTSSLLSGRLGGEWILF